jgi:hypothetical protein
MGLDHLPVAPSLVGKTQTVHSTCARSIAGVRRAWASRRSAGGEEDRMRFLR